MADASTSVLKFGSGTRDVMQSAEWEFFGPNPALKPIFGVTRDRSGAVTLTARGNGRDECYGYARCPVYLNGGRSYRLRVRLRPDGIESPEHHVGHGVFARAFSGGILALQKDGAHLAGEERFPGPDEPLLAELRLYFRYSARGSVTWKEVTLEELDPIPARPVTLVCREGVMPAGSSLAYWAEWLDLAGLRNPDLVLLPELFDGQTPANPSPPDGPAATLLAAKARQWKMFTCGAFYQERGDLVYNTAPLYDRSGKLAGSYDKFLPYEGELDQGASPGRELRTFDTGFGRIGIMTCYDSWFPEVAREYARQGAEIVLLPNAGYYEDLIPARAADNGLCIAASSLNHPAGIWDSSGARAGEDGSGVSREAPSAFLSTVHDKSAGMLVATVDLSKRYTPHWKGGPMLSAPAAHPARQTGLRPLR